MFRKKLSVCNVQVNTGLADKCSISFNLFGKDRVRRRYVSCSKKNPKRFNTKNKQIGSNRNPHQQFPTLVHYRIKTSEHFASKACYKIKRLGGGGVASRSTQVSASKKDPTKNPHQQFSPLTCYRIKKHYLFGAKTCYKFKIWWFCLQNHPNITKIHQIDPNSTKEEPTPAILN